MTDLSYAEWIEDAAQWLRDEYDETEAWQMYERWLNGDDAMVD